MSNLILINRLKILFSRVEKTTFILKYAKKKYSYICIWLTITYVLFVII